MPRVIWGAFAACVAIAVAPAAALATADRSDYDAQVNPICASANAQSKQLYETIEQQLSRLDRKADKARGKKRRRLEARSERIFEQAPSRSLAISIAELTQLKAVSPAPGDESLVSEWLNNRQLILDLSAQANRIETRAERLFSGGPQGHTIRSVRQWQRRLNKLEAKENEIYSQIEPLYERDIELGTRLGATYCVTSATGSG